jgi:predicted Ser/Thr protein kinase/protocatechuate 3,4-dioxygenase beta subunit
MAKPVGVTLGRYHLERELGTGAMGVVYAAFDPDLERRIAVKVLRAAIATREARERLMREARAMARLTHPNVVTVHEVGTAAGRDFVAMELVHGETLAAWLRSSKRSPAAIVDAFLAAGRGLAAAHAAGIVHRDFKPHNVLRSREGRIVVTDFGLAHDAHDALPGSSDAASPGGAPATTAVSPLRSLSRLTVTGSLLGTPAYMAPEQWRGGAITPATDQFAYCVALWEALAGERPYPGPTFQDLRTQVAHGPAALDASNLPRRVRSLLRRGMDPDPARRWPSMNALLVELGRAQRTPGVAMTAGAIVVVAALLAVMRFGDVPGTACDPPARAVTAVWSPVIAADLRVKTSDAYAAVLDAAVRDWQATRAKVCTASPPGKQAQLLCLDGVLARLDALRQAYTRVPGASAEGIQGQLIDPEVCHKPVVADVPRLTLAPTPDVLAAYELSARSEIAPSPSSDAGLSALAETPNADPCARVIASLAFQATSKDVPRVRSVMTSVANMVDQCGDERLRADLLIQDALYHAELPVIGPKGEAALQQAQVAAQRVMQPDIEAALAARRIFLLLQRRHWDEVFRLVESEIAGYGARGLHVRQANAVVRRARLRMIHPDPGDLEAVIADAQNWRPVATASHKADLAADLDMQAALARFWLGDVMAAHTELQRLWQARPSTDQEGGTHQIHGEVVDPRGRPVAGASVAVADLLYADSAGIGSPVFKVDYLRITTTDEAGHFTLTGAAKIGAIAAQLADRRSPPAAIADHVRLVLAPTRSVSGKVELQRRPHTRLYVFCMDAHDPTGRFRIVAPVAADGSFAIAGATIGAVRVGVSVKDEDDVNGLLEFQTLPASPTSIADLQLALTSPPRSVDVLVRSAVATPLQGAQVVLLPGRHQIRNVNDLDRLSISGMRTQFAKLVVAGNTAKPVLDKMRSGDLVAHIEHVAAGELTACAVAFTGDLLDPQTWQGIQEHLSELAFRCEPIGPDAAVVVLSVPPQSRFD